MPKVRIRTASGRMKTVETTKVKVEATLEEKIKYEIDNIDWFFQHNLKSIDKRREEFLTGVLTDILYELRNCEKVMEAELERKEIKRMKAIYDENFQIASYAGALKALRQYQDMVLEDILNSPYKHNSTCVFSNLFQAKEIEVRAGVWRKGGWSGSTVRDIIRSLEKLVEYEKELFQRNCGSIAS